MFLAESATIWLKRAFMKKLVSVRSVIQSGHRKQAIEAI